MFASLKTLTILAAFFGSSTMVTAAPSASAPDAALMDAFGLTSADLVQSRNTEVGSILLPRVASCAPPTSPKDATYGACILPLDSYAKEGNGISMLRLGEYLTQKMGCPSSRITGGAARPVVQIKAYGCTHSGPTDYVNGGPAGWSINTAFNEKACLPGYKCA